MLEELERLVNDHLFAVDKDNCPNFWAERKIGIQTAAIDDETICKMASNWASRGKYKFCLVAVDIEQPLERFTAGDKEVVIVFYFRGEGFIPKNFREWAKEIERIG